MTEGLRDEVARLRDELDWYAQVRVEAEGDAVVLALVREVQAWRRFYECPAGHEARLRMVNDAERCKTARAATDRALSESAGEQCDAD